jgi:hypothetical protein
MPIKTDKQQRLCKYCNKSFANLGLHIINNHPNIMEQLEENAPILPTETTTRLEPTTSLIKNPVVSVNNMVAEALQTMLNIKIIEMLSGSNNASLQEIGKVLNPPPQTTLQDIKAYHDLVYEDRGRDREEDVPESGNQWIDLATQAIPLVRDMMNRGGNKHVEHTGIKEADRGEYSELQHEVARDTKQPISISGKSGEPSRGATTNIKRISIIGGGDA